MKTFKITGTNGSYGAKPVTKLFMAMSPKIAIQKAKAYWWFIMKIEEVK